MERKQAGAVFLDRDGVINPHPRYVNSPDDFELYPWAAASIRRLNEAGWPVFVVTNQGGVGLGYMSEADLAAIHAKMESELAKSGAALVEIAVCTHRPHDKCACRKPEPGMLISLSKSHHVDLKKSFMVGDRDVDVRAGKQAGALTIYIGEPPFPEADFSVANLSEAVDMILRHQRA